MTPAVKQALRDVWQFAVEGGLNRFTLTPWLSYDDWFGMYRLGEQIPDFILSRKTKLDCGTITYLGRVQSPWVSREVREKEYTVANPEFFFCRVDRIISEMRPRMTVLTPEEHQEFIRIVDGMFPDIENRRIQDYAYVRRSTG